MAEDGGREQDAIACARNPSDSIRLERRDRHARVTADITLRTVVDIEKECH